MDAITPPRLIFGGLHADARGTVSFVNEFDFKGVDRFYTIRPRRARDPRGWIGHRHETKWFTAIQGTILVAVVTPDAWDHRVSNRPVSRFVLFDSKPAVLHVPPGHATATMALSDDAVLTVFSSGKIEHADQDDHRFAVDTWPVAEDGPT